MNIGWLTRRRSGRQDETDERVAAFTDRGRRRTENQDAVLVREMPDGTVLAALADGVGGTSGGEIASWTAIEAVLDEVSANACEPPGHVLQRAFAAAHRSVRFEAQERELEGMATTLVAALVGDGAAWVAHVGDSRAYVLDGDGLRRITEDHSWVAEQVRTGRMTAEEVVSSPYRNIITRGVGVSDEVEPDVTGPIAIPEGVLLLLCSDGLHTVVSDEQIAGALGSGTPSEMAARLVLMANDAGGPDNVSVVIVRG